MRGYNHRLVVTTTFDEVSGTEVPLFQFPIQVCKASKDVEVRLDTAAPSGAPVGRVWKDKVKGTYHTDGELRKGVRTGDQFQEIDAEQLKAIDASIKSDVIQVERSLPLADVPFDRVIDTAFLQVPSKAPAAKEYRLLYEGLLARPRKGKTPARPAMALRVKYVGTTRQKLGVIYADPERGCLMLVALRFAAQQVEPDEQVLAFQAAEVAQPMVDKVRAVIEKLDDDAAGGFDAPVDETIERRAALVEQALAGEAIVAPTEEAEVVTTDAVEDALEASLAALG